VSIEAGRTTPWRALVGDDGITIGVDRFGASAPARALAEHLGLTPEQVAEKILGA
jgi:transketolase